MQKTLINSVIIFTLFFSVNIAKADSPTDLYDEATCYYGWGDEVEVGYHVYDGQVYYYNCPLQGVDAKTIKPLTENGEEIWGYSTDKNYIYYMTRRLDGLNPNNFNIKQIDDNGVILYDKDTVYFDASEVSDSSMYI